MIGRYISWHSCLPPDKYNQEMIGICRLQENLQKWKKEAATEGGST